MSLIVAGRFDTFAEAERAGRTLFEHGFVDEDVTLFFVNPRGQHDRLPFGGDRLADPGAARAGKGASSGMALGAAFGAAAGIAIFALSHAPLLVSIIAAGVGAYVGSFVGAMQRSAKPPAPHALPDDTQQPVREAGVLLAVHVTADNQREAAAVLRSAGAREVERASGRWQQGRWADFDPTRPPQPA